MRTFDKIGFAHMVMDQLGCKVVRHDESHIYYVKLNEKAELGTDNGFTMAIMKFINDIPVFNLRASNLPYFAMLLGHCASSAGDFDIGESFEINFEDRVIYGDDAVKFTADNIHRVWYGVDKEELNDEAEVLKIMEKDDDSLSIPEKKVLH